MKRVLIAGGSGLIGKELTTLLQAAGYEVAWLSRSSSKTQAVPCYAWDIEQQTIDERAIAWADILIHLAGEGIAAKRWTKRRKQEIITSRTASTNLLLQAMLRVPNRIQTVIAASAVGYYGNTAHLVQEDAQAGSGFLAESVLQWETSTQLFAQTGARCVTLRIGVVLSRKGGAYRELTQTAGMRILPVLGNGKQVYPWIHIQDVAKIFLFAIEQGISGTFNAVAPNPIHQKKLMQTIGATKGGLYIYAPAPAFGLRLVLGEMADAVLISQHVSSAKLENAGYRFDFPTIEAAVQQIEHAPPKR